MTRLSLADELTQAALFESNESRRKVLEEAAGKVAELVETAQGAEAFIGVMFGRYDGTMPTTVDTPLGVPVKVGAIFGDLTSAIAAVSAQP